MADTQVNQTSGGDGGRGPLYALIAIVIVLLIVVIILFVPGQVGNGTRDIDADIQIEVPQMPETPDAPSPGQGDPDGP